MRSGETMTLQNVQAKSGSSKRDWKTLGLAWRSSTPYRNEFVGVTRFLRSIMVFGRRGLATPAFISGHNWPYISVLINRTFKISQDLTLLHPQLLHPAKPVISTTCGTSTRLRFWVFRVTASGETCHSRYSAHIHNWVNEMSNSTFKNVKTFAKRSSAQHDFSYRAMLPKYEIMLQEGNSRTRPCYRRSKLYLTILNFFWYTFICVLLFWNYCHRTMRLNSRLSFRMTRLSHRMRLLSDRPMRLSYKSTEISVVILKAKKLMPAA